MQENDKSLLIIGGAAILAGVLLLKGKEEEPTKKATLSGTVLSKYNQSAIVGITVNVNGKTGITNSSGEYNITGLAVGTATIQIQASDYQPYTVQKELFEGSNSLSIQLTPLVPLSMTVRDSSTQVPIYGVTVTIGTKQYTTNTVGQVLITLPFGSYTIMAAMSGYTTQTITYNLAPPAGVLVFDLVPVFAQTGVIQGRVTNPATSGIGGARITCGGYTTNTDYQGYYSLEVPSGTYNIFCTATDYKDAVRESFQVRTGTYNTINFTLEPTQVTPGYGYGYVTNAQTGAAIAGARVWVNETAPGGAIGYSDTNSQGYYLIMAIPGTYTLSVEKEGYSRPTPKTITIVANGNSRVDFTLQPSVTNLGFRMNVEIDYYGPYNAAVKWYAELGGLTAWFLPCDALWDNSNINLNNMSWPQNLTVELYDVNETMIFQRTISVTLVNGHEYSFYAKPSGSYLADNGMY